MSHDRICTCNVSVVRINGNTIQVGAPSLGSYDVTRFAALELMFEPCKVCVLACFGAYKFAEIHLRVQVSDMTCRMIGFVLLMCLLHG